jgi:hypothetical protein
MVVLPRVTEGAFHPYKHWIKRILSELFATVVNLWTLPAGSSALIFRLQSATVFRRSRRCALTRAITSAVAARGISSNPFILESRTDLPFTHERILAQQSAGLSLRFFLYLRCLSSVAVL